MTTLAMTTRDTQPVAEARTTPHESFEDVHHRFWCGIHSMFQVDVPIVQAAKKQKLDIDPATPTNIAQLIQVRQAEEVEHEAELAQIKSTIVLTPFDLFKKFVISGQPGKFIMDASAPRNKWVAYTTLHLAFRPYAPNIGLKGPGCLSKLMAEWYKDELADGRLVAKKFRRAGDREGQKVAHFSFTQVPRS